MISGKFKGKQRKGGEPREKCLNRQAVWPRKRKTTELDKSTQDSTKWESRIAMPSCMALDDDELKLLFIFGERL